MLPAERLLELVRESFSYRWLAELDETLEQLPPMGPQQQVGVFVARRTCAEVRAFLDGIQPVTATRLDAIAAVLGPPLIAVVGALAKFRQVHWTMLAQLISASREVRVKG